MASEVEPIFAWHFLKAGGITGEGGLQVVVGETMRVTPPVELCAHGLHWSRRAIDALQYAPGPVVQYVRASGDVQEEGDKGCSSERTCIALADATHVLHAFACDTAEAALQAECAAGRQPDGRSWVAIAMKRRWLCSEANDMDLGIAQGLAWVAVDNFPTGSAARAAAVSAAEVTGSFPLAARRAAAWAMAAARAAEKDGARDAAWSAAGERLNADLERRLRALLGLDEEVCRGE